MFFFKYSSYLFKHSFAFCLRELVAFLTTSFRLVTQRGLKYLHFVLISNYHQSIQNC